MNFSYGIIAIVGVLTAVSLGFIVASPDDIIQPRMDLVDVVEPQTDLVDVVEPQTDLVDVVEPQTDLVDVVEPQTDLIDDSFIVCTAQWDPVCGVNGETYSNSCVLDSSNVEFDYIGECMSKEKMTETIMANETVSLTDTVKTTESMDGSKSIKVNETVNATDTVKATESIPETAADTILIPVGAAVLGCDATNECYLPYEATVSAGTTVTWNNIDSAAHTVTSGLSSTGHDGLFDSSLFMPGSIFEFTFTDPGTFDYYCMVHPWMTGIVNVN